MTARQRGWTLLAVIAAVLIAAVLPGPTVSALSAQPSRERMTVSIEVTNRNARRIGRSWERFALVSSGGLAQPLGRRRTPRLAPGSRHRSRPTFTYRSPAVGDWHLRACTRTGCRSTGVLITVHPAPEPAEPTPKHPPEDASVTPTPTPTPQPAPTPAGDLSPPKFAGIKSAITCVPGPIGGDRTTVYHLSWDPGSDDTTPPDRLVYDVYQADKPGGEDFSNPTYTSGPGDTKLDTAAIRSDASVYFVVRARDEAGNRDANAVELQGQNLCV